MLTAAHTTKEKRRLESTVHANLLGNQGVEAIQLTVQGANGWQGRPLIEYGGTLELRVRVHLHIGGWVELEVEE